jgi:hypothetical protein
MPPDQNLAIALVPTSPAPADPPFPLGAAGWVEPPRAALNGMPARKV